MARADSFLVNDNVHLKSTTVLDSFTDWHIFENIFMKNKRKLEKSAKIMEIDARFDYRPDLLAFEVYGEDFFFPVILMANNLGSILQFKSELLDNKCKIPDINLIKNLVSTAKVSQEKKFKETEGYK